MTSKLFQLCTQDHEGGYGSTILPGACIRFDNSPDSPSASTVRRWERRGWIRRCGERFVLTREGYRAA